MLQDTNKVLAISRIMVAWQPVGLALGVYDMCVRYLKERQQFGVPLAAFQVPSMPQHQGRLGQWGEWLRAAVWHCLAAAAALGGICGQPALSVQLSGTVHDAAWHVGFLGPLAASAYGWAETAPLGHTLVQKMK